MTMSHVNNYTYFFVVLFCFLSCDALNEERSIADERIKIGIREAGNRLLLSQGDSTSLILPVEKISESKYLLRFKDNHSFEPNTIVNAVKESFQKGQLPYQYIVQVLQCENQKVAYSYEMHKEEEKTLIPCAGRALPADCYMFEIRFLSASKPKQGGLLWFLLVIPLVITALMLSKKRKSKNLKFQTESYNRIGSFKFYPNENKLVKETEEFALTKKECEILSLLIAQPNQVISRELLTKKIWEDNGVIVGRSLDTYISKLRKKLASDTSIKITNIHSIGYKLEVLAVEN